MSVNIVGVHGVGHLRPGISAEQAAGRLGAQWSSHLNRALGDRAGPVAVAVAYYAADLNVDVAQGSQDPLQTLPPDLYPQLIAWAQHLDAIPADLAQAAWSVPARMIVDRMAACRRLNAVTLRPFVAMFLREVDAYLRRPGSPARRAARDRVVETIRRHQARVVIAHSLGSVVAYEALWAYPHLPVELLITIGSPLGMAGVVAERLNPTPTGPGRTRPPNVGHWVNIADPGDIVAVPRPFTRLFQPDDNREDSHIHWLDFHSATRYLAAAPTVRAIARYLGHR